MTNILRAALLRFGRTFGPAFGLLSLTAGWAPAAEFPARYYRLMEAGCANIEKHLDEQPDADLKTKQADGSWKAIADMINSDMPPGA
jgi:hypothetical protein